MRALAQHLGERGRIRLGALAGEEDLLDVALGERALPRRELHHHRAVPRPLGGAGREREAHHGPDREHRDDRGDHRASSGRERLNRTGPLHHDTTRLVRIPPK